MAVVRDSYALLVSKREGEVSLTPEQQQVLEVIVPKMKRQEYHSFTAWHYW